MENKNRLKTKPYKTDFNFLSWTVHLYICKIPVGPANRVYIYPVKQCFITAKLTSLLGESFTVPIMTWYLFTECLYHRWSLECSACCNQIPTCHRFISIATQRPSCMNVLSDFTSGLSGLLDAQSLRLSLVFCEVCFRVLSVSSDFSYWSDWQDEADNTRDNSTYDLTVEEILTDLF